MSTRPFGLHLDATQPFLTEPEIASLHARVHLVMTAPGGGGNGAHELRLVDRYRGIIPEDTLMVWRTWDRRESNWTLYPSSAEQVSIWKKEGRAGIIRDDPCNEPSLPADRGLNKAYVRRSVELLNRAADAGFRVAVGAFSVGTPHHSFIEEGLYDDLLRAIGQGGHYLSYHSYGTFIPEAGELLPADLLLHPSDAGRVLLDTTKWPINRYWFLRRTDWFVLRAQQIGVPIPRTIMTEGVFDTILTDVLNQLRPAYGMAEYNKDLRGVLSWQRYARDVFPDKTFHQALSIVMEHLARAVYWPEYIEGVCLFAINANWDRPQGHNWGNDRLKDWVLSELPRINLMLADPVLSNPTPTEPGTLTVNGVRVRETPGTHSTTLDTLAGSYRNVLRAPQSRQVDGHTWYFVAIPDERLAGWISWDVISSWVPAVQSPPDNPKPADDVTITIDLQREHAMILADTLSLIADKIRNNNTDRR